MDATTDDPADDTDGSILGHVDYRHIVAILQKHYPQMSAEEAARLVLEYIQPPATEAPPGNTAADPEAA
jgi:hypothetical protein